MSSQNWSWVGAPQVSRAPRVSQLDWICHQTLLIDLYRRMSLKELMTWMKTHHNFSPSQHQYVLQFEKWGLQKYNKSSKNDNNIQDQGASTTPLENSVESTSTESGWSAESQVVEQRLKRKQSPPERLVKRLKAVDQKEPCESDNPVVDGLSYSTVKTSSCQPVATDADHHELASVTGSSDPVKETFSSQPESQSLQYREAKATTPQPITPDGKFSLAERMIDPLLVREDQAQEISKILKQLDSPDFSELVHELKPRTAEVIMIIADFLAVSQCPAEAFVLFTLVVKLHRANQDIPQHLLKYALTGCTRNAVSQSHIDIVENMIKRRVEDLPPPTSEAHCSLQVATYQSLLYELNTKAIHSSYVYLKTRVQNEKVWPRYSILTASHNKKPFLFEMAYSNVDYVHPEKLWAHDVEIHLLSNVIRLCLDWCIVQLKSINGFFARVRKRFKFCVDDTFADFLALYHTLFGACISSVKEGDLLPWTPCLESDLGITSARFVADISLMIRWQFRLRPVYLSNEEWFDEVYRGALLACKKLSVYSDENMARNFFHFHHLIDAGTYGYWELSAENDYGRQLGTFVKQQVKGLLNIDLPDLPPLEIGQSTNRMAGEPVNNVSRDVFSNLDTTLAASLHSSNYRSLEATRQRLQTAIENRAIYIKSVPSSKDSRKGDHSSFPRFSMSEKWSLSQYLPRTPSKTSKGNEIDSITSHCSAMSLDEQEPERGKDKITVVHQWYSARFYVDGLNAGIAI